MQRLLPDQMDFGSALQTARDSGLIEQLFPEGGSQGVLLPDGTIHEKGGAWLFWLTDHSGVGNKNRASCIAIRPWVPVSDYEEYDFSKIDEYPMQVNQEYKPVAFAVRCIQVLTADTADAE